MTYTEFQFSYEVISDVLLRWIRIHDDGTGYLRINDTTYLYSELKPEIEQGTLLGKQAVAALLLCLDIISKAEYVELIQTDERA